MIGNREFWPVLSQPDGIRFGLANRRLRPLGHLTANASLIEISHWRRRRFFEPPHVSKPPENIADFAGAPEIVWAHSRKASAIPRRADGARCASPAINSPSLPIPPSSEISDPVPQSPSAPLSWGVSFYVVRKSISLSPYNSRQKIGAPSSKQWLPRSWRRTRPTSNYVRQR